MRKAAPTLVLLATTLVCALHADPAAAQRVFVAAQGSDANPCRFAAPCRTFQHAHDVVPAGGEIDVLDPAGYGVVNITKSISIQGHGFAGIGVTSGLTGVSINAGTTDVINLRGLLIEGSGAGTNGITFTSGAALTIDNCLVRNLVNIGINFQPGNSSSLVISNTVVANIKNTYGIQVLRVPAVTLTATFNRVEAYNSFSGGITVQSSLSAGTIKASVVDSIAANNGKGIVVSSPGLPATISVLVFNSVAANNAAHGISSEGTGTVVRLRNSAITGNGTGVAASSGGQLSSFGDNSIIDNGTDGSPTGTVSLN